MGSGITESGVKLFGKRVKGREEFWSVQGAAAILALRSQWLGEDEASRHSWLGWPVGCVYLTSARAGMGPTVLWAATLSHAVMLSLCRTRIAVAVAASLTLMFALFAAELVPNVVTGFLMLTLGLLMMVESIIAVWELLAISLHDPEGIPSDAHQLSQEVAIVPYPLIWAELLVARVVALVVCVVGAW